jgi:hypothetical protein
VTTAWRGLALIAVAAGLMVCRRAGGGERPAAGPMRDAGAGAPAAAHVAPATVPPPVAAPAAPAATAAPGDASSKPAPTLKPAACAQLQRRVEQELGAAQRCKGADECIGTPFEYAFRPCGLSVKKGAALDKVAADAKRYQDGCHPVIHPVRCAYLPRATCERGRCTLAPPLPN